MRLRRGEFERIQSVLVNADPDEPLTAREILELLAVFGEQIEDFARGQGFVRVGVS